ncbi:MAG TPA: hypothetical protein DCZ93_09955 [Elusimicrobia bacterium]|nr:hypothetical protein [Elusimicrobiota bacterium]
MKKSYGSLICGGLLAGLLLPVFAGRSGISSGGSLNPDGPVKSVSIGGGVSGKGSGVISGLGLPYMLKKAVSVLSRPQATVAKVKVEAAGPSSAFALGEVYVYPNPAKGGQVPTFHIEIGIADNVKINVYAVSGDLVHSYTIAGNPATVDDGQGAQYAYEYAWRGHIPSGIYYFAIEAAKDGKKLKKTGKFAVIR